MATGLVIHISSGDDKHTEVLTGERLRIGNCDDCDLRLRASALPKRPEGDGLVLELEGRNGSYSVVGFDPDLNLTLNGQPLETNVCPAHRISARSMNLTASASPIIYSPRMISSRPETASKLAQPHK